MDNEGNYRQQSLTNMQKAVYKGELSVVDYYERQVWKIIGDFDYEFFVMTNDLLTSLIQDKSLT